VPIVEIQCVLFPIDPVRLYRLLDFYRADPRARAELGTEASLRRVRDGRFPPDQRRPAAMKALACVARSIPSVHRSRQTASRSDRSGDTTARENDSNVTGPA
jgi:hypothetical protein